MPPITRIFPLALIAGVLGTGLALPASSAPEFDGVWKVTTSAETGKCATNYDVSVRVTNGKVSYAGVWPVKASGGINDVGLVRMELAHAGKTVAATGLVRGNRASGDWNSKTDDCAGSWVARRA